MIKHTEIPNRELLKKIRLKKICMGGYLKLKIYGTLQCKSGKRMKPENRVFFSSQNEAIELGFRPCGHCMKAEYQKWKDGSIQ